MNTHWAARKAAELRRLADELSAPVAFGDWRTAKLREASAREYRRQAVRLERIASGSSRRPWNPASDEAA